MDLLQEAGTTDEGVELKIERKYPKCRKILSNASFAMRSSFRKCGFRRLVGPVHEGIQEDFLNCGSRYLLRLPDKKIFGYYPVNQHWL